MTTGQKPPHATHWSTRTITAAAGISEASVRASGHAHGLKPHRVETFKRSNDPAFAEKLEDIPGLYLHPPEHALVLGVDEKSHIQALDRTQPGLPRKKGLRRGVFRDLEELIPAIGTYIDTHNEAPKPFIWTAKAADILEKVKRARHALHPGLSA